jgi:hypothetical protein
VGLQPGAIAAASRTLWRLDVSGRYTSRVMAEKTETPLVTLADYQEQVAQYRGKLSWVGDYL